MEFNTETPFSIHFDRAGNIIILVRISPLPSFMQAGIPWAAFGSLSDARAFGQMVIDFCDENETEVPEAIRKAFEQNNAK